MKKCLGISIILSGIIQYSYACTQNNTPVSEDILRNSYQLIAIATVSDITPIKTQNNNISYFEADTLYSFTINKIFKGGQDIKEFTIAEESLSSCSKSYMSGEKYLLYLNPNQQEPKRYMAFHQASVRVVNLDIDIPYDTMWEQLWYTVSSKIKQGVAIVKNGRLYHIHIIINANNINKKIHNLYCHYSTHSNNKRLNNKLCHTQQNTKRNKTNQNIYRRTTLLNKQKK